MSSNLSPAFISPYFRPKLQTFITSRPAANFVCFPAVTYRTFTICAQQKSPPSQPQWNSEDDLLTRLQAFPDDDPPPRPETDLDEYKGQLAASIEYLRDDLANDLEVFFSKPTRLLSTSAIALLGGIFAATSAATIIGSVADWDPLAAAVLLIWTEAFTKYYYYLEKRSRFLQIINAFKIGLIYGMILDAFKLST